MTTWSRMAAECEDHAEQARAKMDDVIEEMKETASATLPAVWARLS